MDDAPAAIETESLIVGYRSVPVAGPLDLRVGIGEFVAISGRSGCGKSTFLFTLGQMLTPISGTVTSFGSTLSTARDAARSHWRASQVGFIFQDALLDTSRTVIDSITEGALYRNQDPQALRSRASELLDEVGLDLPLDRRPGEISGGQAQRVALCRALLGRPSLILADEPTGNLDQQTAQTILAVLRERTRAGAAVVVATHAADVMDVADRTLALSGSGLSCLSP